MTWAREARYHLRTEASGEEEVHPVEQAQLKPQRRASAAAEDHQAWEPQVAPQAPVLD